MFENISLLNSTVMAIRGTQGIARGTEMTLCGITAAGINVCLENGDIHAFEASSMEVDGNSINLYRAGTRELTSSEKSLLKASKNLLTREEKEKLAGSSVGFYRRKRFFEENQAIYLMGFGPSDGKMLEGDVIRDASVRGELVTSFRITASPKTVCVV